MEIAAQIQEINQKVQDESGFVQRLIVARCTA